MDTKKLIKFVRNIFNTNDFVPLHAPVFAGNEKEYTRNTIESTFVSSVGGYVDDFEQKLKEFTRSKMVVSVMNGTAAISTALYLSDVKRDDYVITQSMTFVATCNAIYHLGAKPILLDVSKKSMGLCPIALENYLAENAKSVDGRCMHKKTNKPIKAVIPMHTFGHPVEMDEIIRICEDWNLFLIEDAAESFGSFYKGKHTGTLGKFGTLSFNGNKIITTGGGGALLCSSKELGKSAKHITTTAKIKHPTDFFHDEPGFNYRMPNINAALGCAQLESINIFLEKKRELANLYRDFFSNSDFRFFEEPIYAKSNYWLNTIICPDEKTKENLLSETNKSGVMTRPVWTLMNKLPMYSDSLTGDLSQCEFFEKHIVNIPSSVNLQL